MWDEARTTCTRNEDHVQNEALKRKGGSERYKKKVEKNLEQGKQA